MFLNLSLVHMAQNKIQHLLVNFWLYILLIFLPCHFRNNCASHQFYPNEEICHFLVYMSPPWTIKWFSSNEEFYCFWHVYTIDSNYIFSVSISWTNHISWISQYVNSFKKIVKIIGKMLGQLMCGKKDAEMAFLQLMTLNILLWILVIVLKIGTSSTCRICFFRWCQGYFWVTKQLLRLCLFWPENSNHNV